MLKEYDKVKDDRARGLWRRDANFYSCAGGPMLTSDQDPLGPPVIDEKISASERAGYKELNGELAERLKHVFSRPPIADGDVTPRPASDDMDT
eukprot:1711547-Heterocapsa_arctica.AAC.1